MCSQLEKFIEVAAGEVGYIEGPADNETKYQKANQPWCGAFVNWCAKQVALRFLIAPTHRQGQRRSPLRSVGK